MYLNVQEQQQAENRYKKEYRLDNQVHSEWSHTSKEMQ